VLPVRGPAYPLSVCWCSCGCRCSLRVALRRPRQPWRRWSWCRLPRCSVSAAAPTSSGAARRAREASARASPSSWPCTGWLPPVAWLWRGGAPPLAVSPALRAGASRQQHWQQPSAALLQKEKHPGSPGKPLCRRCRATPGVASGSRGGPSGRPCRQARTAVPPHCLCRLFPCPVGFVQNPFVYRAKLNTAAFSACNPVNFPHLARVGPLYDKRVSHPLECQLLW
jgi:hypothetical protein